MTIFNLHNNLMGVLIVLINVIREDKETEAQRTSVILVT